MKLTMREKQHIRALLMNHVETWDGAFETANYYGLSVEEINRYHEEWADRIKVAFSCPRLVLDDSPHDPPFLKQPA